MSLIASLNKLNENLEFKLNYNRLQNISENFHIKLEKV
jgi:hypothetical protein